MDTSGEICLVGPTTNDGCLQLCPPHSWIVEPCPGQFWAVVDTSLARAREIAVQLGTALCVVQVELENDLESDGHKGTVTLYRQVEGPGRWSVDDEEEFWEEELIRGGVIVEVAVEHGVLYLQRREETLASTASVAEEHPGESDERAATLVDALAGAGKLELVNRRARQTLRPRIELELMIAAGDLERAAKAILEALVDAPEVVEVYADETELLALLKNA